MIYICTCKFISTISYRLQPIPKRNFTYGRAMIACSLDCFVMHKAGPAVLTPWTLWSLWPSKRQQLKVHLVSKLYSPPERKQSLCIYVCICIIYMHTYNNIYVCVCEYACTCVCISYIYTLHGQIDINHICIDKTI